MRIMNKNLKRYLLIEKLNNNLRFQSFGSHRWRSTVVLFWFLFKVNSTLKNKRNADYLIFIKVLTLCNYCISVAIISFKVQSYQLNRNLRRTGNNLLNSHMLCQVTNIGILLALSCSTVDAIEDYTTYSVLQYRTSKVSQKTTVL